LLTRADVWGFDESAVKALKSMEPEPETPTVMAGKTQKQLVEVLLGDSSANVLTPSQTTAPQVLIWSYC